MAAHAAGARADRLHRLRGRGRAIVPLRNDATGESDAAAREVFDRFSADAARAGETAAAKKCRKKKKKKKAAAAPAEDAGDAAGDEDAAADGDGGGDAADDADGGEGEGAEAKKKKKRKKKKKAPAGEGSKPPLSRLLGGFTDSYVRGADVLRTGRGDAAAATRIVRATRRG